MDFDRIAVILKKISRLVETLKEADIEVSSIEKELILSYIRELQSEVGSHTANKKAPEVFTDAKPAVKTEEVSADEAEDSTVPGESAEKNENENAEHFHDREETSGTSADNEPEDEETVAEAGSEYSEELEALFEIDEGSELSDKLSMSPIKDLRKSMGVNERIFTINELFDGDQRLFDEVILYLNNLSSFEDAADYLKKKVAHPNDWDEKSRMKKAQHFIRLIYRRYL